MSVTAVGFQPCGKVVSLCSSVWLIRNKEVPPGPILPRPPPLLPLSLISLSELIRTDSRLILAIMTVGPVRHVPGVRPLAGILVTRP